ncbi:MAG TPA: hypothetical protein VHO70_06485 [Chitinispirillaceae bacterium]|nr:hypothetical protein [Chitinispirillaceae bacterium]
MKKGFTTKEGLFAISGLLGAIIVAIIGFGDRFYLTAIFVVFILIFIIIYGNKLCKTCEKNCPCNPDMHFWKNALSEIGVKKQNK